MKRRPALDERKIAALLGAELRGTVVAGAGYFGALQLVADVQSRFRSPRGGGRATDPAWTERRLIPLAPKTLARLNRLAKRLLEREGVAISPLQLAGLLLERAAAEVEDSGADHLPRR